MITNLKFLIFLFLGILQIAYSTVEIRPIPDEDCQSSFHGVSGNEECKHCQMLVQDGRFEYPVCTKCHIGFDLEEEPQFGGIYFTKCVSKGIICQNQRCKTCENSTTIECAACKPNREGQQCTCIEGMFEQDLECLQCKPWCISCSEETTCDSCKAANRQGVSCECIAGYHSTNTDKTLDCCKIGYYMKNRKCEKCHPRCKSCIEEADNCTECQGKNRSLSHPQCICNPGYFDDNTNTNCQKCNSPCKNCQKSADQCTDCISENHILQGKKCVCIYGMFMKQDTLCEQCAFPCSSCIGNARNCDSCQIQENRSLVYPECHCKKGSFEQDNTCIKCNPVCEKCEGTNKCSKCKPDKTRQMDTDFCQCKPGYYEPQELLSDEQNTSCLPCPSHCVLCQSESVCMVCVNPTFRPPHCQGIQKRFFTQEIEIINIEDYHELQCLPRCFECKTRRENCTVCSTFGLNRNVEPPSCSCIEGYHDQNGEMLDCVQCPKQCKTCMNKVQCTSCYSTEQNREFDSFSMDCVCKVGYKEVKETKICKKCYFLKSDCVFTCPENSIQDEISGQCIGINGVPIQNLILFYLLWSIIILSVLLFLFKREYFFPKYPHILAQQNENQHEHNENENNENEQQIPETEQRINVDIQNP